ncbi:hypothetical protein [Massilia sp. BJB1822]|uniref:hypothetical protein n=1 Tax=Massilia sp. BJB1822 TaxID=2744470 RepID=UPI001594B862|nr:hypothetical protein [Massilia sp. BJB1822]NVD97098.1 hypothetical protein [Massilia sp. BJB1822]
MRKIIVEVPIGALVKLERITLVEAALKSGKRKQLKPSKAYRLNKAPIWRTFELKSGASPPLLEQRSLALSKVFGIFKGRPDAPQDGLAFQQAMRAE